MTKYESLIMKAEEELNKAFKCENEKERERLKKKYNKLVNQARNLTLAKASEDV